MTRVAVAAAPVKVVVAHGTGGGCVRELEMTVCGESLLWLLQAIDELRALGGDAQAIDQVAVIANGLVHLEAAEVRDLFADVLWRAWLAELRHALAPGNAEGRPLEPLLWRLPVLVAPLLGRIGGQSAWTAMLPATMRIGPFGGETYLSSTTGGDLPVQVVQNADGWSLHVDTRACSASDAPVGATPRLRVGHGIDVLDADSFPELAAHRRSIEVSSTASPRQVDHHLAEVFALLEQGWPAAMEDVRAFFRGVFPIDSGPGHWNSASTDAVPLALQLTFPDVSMPLALGESVLHETAHVKLDLLMAMVPLLENTGERVYRHPWREDLRPLSGVLMGAHAFLNVVLYYRQMVEAGLGGTEAERELARRRGEVLVALELLGTHGRFTHEGLALFEGMVAALRGADD